jgi:pentatricopeptide repeat protein
MHGLCKEGKIVDALDLKRSMELYGLKIDVVTYNVLITGLCKNQCVSDALDLYEEMKSKQLQPNLTTYTTIAGAIYASGRILEGEKLLNDIEDRGFVPSYKDQSPEWRLKNAVRKLNMIRNCRKAITSEDDVEPLHADHESMPAKD